jgi:hypothetical protein
LCPFPNDSAFPEAAIKGLTSFGSGYDSVRGDDGLCIGFDRYLGARSICADFSAAKTP